MRASVCKSSLAPTWVPPVRAFSHCSVQFKLKQMFKSPSFQFLFAGLSLLQQLISLMSFLNSWLLDNRVSAWKPVLSKGEGLGTLDPDTVLPSLSPCTPAPPHPHPPPQAPALGEVVPPILFRRPGPLTLSLSPAPSPSHCLQGVVSP